ncbi:hypothetical protein [Rheinheimera sp. MMS21-TC3]|uniref:hypothetical protein n=1 Tax=Rheinheimera sp. MMS21-TC3 TaxID=3072790 RepID=UPI0028C3BD24|nr:hypothetical protein [Rheinheimera sp. MMS21-TC3]WNO60851.1 hypothetical protein RDV63_07780 [Rheinheimera sp. MMS21-TC3]
MSMEIKTALRQLSEAVLQAGDESLPLLFNAAANAIEDAEKERDQLKAQVKQLRLWADRLSFELAHDDNYQTSHAFCELQDSLAVTPAQCLAEIKARAGRDGFIAGVDYSESANYLPQQPSNLTIKAAEKYANQLRQQAKVGE